MSLDWKWRFGLIHGFGECAWQELAGKVRRLTRIVVNPQVGLGFAKALICALGDDGDPQFDASIVVCSIVPKEEIARALSNAWEPSNIVLPPPNGSRLKLQ